MNFAYYLIIPLALSISLFPNCVPSNINKKDYKLKTVYYPPFSRMIVNAYFKKQLALIQLDTKNFTITRFVTRCVL